MNTSELIRPPAVKPGDLVGIVAPSSPQRDDERLRMGIRWLEQQGFRTRQGASLWNRYGYLAGRDQERLDDLNGMLNDREIRMILCGRGGYGATRILEGVDYDAMMRDPKVFVGFSDVTALNLAFLAHNCITFSGSMPGVDFWSEEPSAFATESFLSVVTGTSGWTRVAGVESAALKGLRGGKADGWLLPANLTLLASLCGSPYLPDTDGAILLIEEIGEEAYRLDRLLSQLWNAGVLQKCAGIALGAFTGTEHTRVSVDPLPVDEVFEHYLSLAAIPAVAEVPYGHIADKLTLPVGAAARIDGDSAMLEVDLSLSPDSTH